MTKADLLALADRCEREEPSRELDCDISNVVFGTRLFPHGASVTGIADTNGNGSVWKGECAFYTASLDAAVTLVPEGWCWRLDCWKAFTARVFELEKRYHTVHVKTSAPLALCAAALRARAALLPEGDAK